MDEGFRLFGEYLMRAAEAAIPVERCPLLDYALENPGYYRLMFIMPPMWQTPTVLGTAGITVWVTRHRLRDAGAVRA